ncbi:unnamed protein product [Nippostrongylus brasiliensis]|uniref:Uncharacterized protein n=1 Tax=Nippostrongylus brasiliensis TaxID=27835 RepID=A0A0N4XSF9_NIPBR|nr:unnamed protein product [Nippostrongylus brasiliensis]
MTRSRGSPTKRCAPIISVLPEVLAVVPLRPPPLGEWEWSVQPISFGLVVPKAQLAPPGRTGCSCSDHPSPIVHDFLF